MGDRTGIAWTDATWNCWQGCHKVSEACANCYMFRDKLRYGQDPTTVVRSAPSTFRKPLVWAANPDKYGHIRRIFPCSWSDFFIEEADAWRPEAWDIIRQTPQFIYQILTKRPERIERHLPPGWKENFRHVWLGCTVETPKQAMRLAFLKAAQPSVRFVSIEPMLGDFTGFEWGGLVDWMICGCESGPKARETQLEWVRNLRDQCLDHGIPFFLKQLVVDGKLTAAPKLDGATWQEFPNLR